MSQARLRFSTSILKRLGEELNPNLDQGILELVKNAYDADALTCTIELQNTREVGGTLRISDDGNGMTRSQIEEGWLVLGSSSKSVDQPTALGRVPVGNKGLGRIAALRMGAVASLLTRPKDDDKEYALDIEWERFNESSTVEDVDLEVVQRSRPNSCKKGTAITISNLRSALDLQEVRRLARGLLLLADPFEDNPKGFRPVLQTPEFKELENLVKRRYFEEAEHHLVAEVNEEGYATARLVDWKGEELYSVGHDGLRPKKSKAAATYGCPPARFDLWTFNLDPKGFAAHTNNVTLPQIREWLREFGGVYLYIRGFRVPPYGNPGNDWLEMNLRRVLVPEFRSSTNNSLGRVTLQDPHEQLFPKTDRSGLIEGIAFQELKRFAGDAIIWTGNQLKNQREVERGNRRVETPKVVAESENRLREVIHTLPAQTQVLINPPFEGYAKQRDREVQLLREEVQLYRTLSTAGITAAVFAHEAKHPVSTLDRDIGVVEGRLKKELGDQYDASFSRPMSRILRQMGLLKTFGALTLDFVDRAKRRKGRVDVHKILREVMQTFEPIMTKRKVTLHLRLDPNGEPYLRGSDAAIESIITNLLVNSLRALLQKQTGQRLIVVETRLIDEGVDLLVSDNGNGIQNIELETIWLPGETTYDEGTGLGLTIVRDTVKDLGGSVQAVAKCDLGGAQIGVKLPILGIKRRN